MLRKPTGPNKTVVCHAEIAIAAIEADLETCEERRRKELNLMLREAKNKLTLEMMRP